MNLIDIEEYKPFRINFKKKRDYSIFAIRDGIICIFLRNDYGWLGVPDERYNRIAYYIIDRGITYIPDDELKELATKFINGDKLLS